MRSSIRPGCLHQVYARWNKCSEMKPYYISKMFGVMYIKHFLKLLFLKAIGKILLKI